MIAVRPLVAALFFHPITKERTMLRWALICLVIALIAGALGLFGLEGAAMQAARILFFVFIVLFIISLVMGRRVPID
jgi:uncharacterized membrane protein YtjA (UPF0391 family)